VVTWQNFGLAATLGHCRGVGSRQGKTLGEKSRTATVDETPILQLRTQHEHASSSVSSAQWPIPYLLGHFRSGLRLYINSPWRVRRRKNCQSDLPHSGYMSFDEPSIARRQPCYATLELGLAKL